MAETNVKFLKENNLFEAHKQFMRMAEGYGYAAPIEEDGDTNGQNADQNDNANTQNFQPNGDNPMGNGGKMDGGNEAEGLNDDGMAMPQDTQQGQPQEVPPMDNVMPFDDEPTDGGDDEEVIDVDDVVKAQEMTNNKVNDVGRDLGTVDKRIEKLIGALETMQGVIDRNNAEIADLKNEFEKRNPTQTEKLNLRALDSYPFNVNPVDYWKRKSADGNYEAYADNEEPTTKEYVITNSDVDNLDGDIDKTFDVSDDDVQDLSKIFNN